MKQFYTYLYFNQQTPIYVGKGYGDRVTIHLTNKTNKNQYFCNKVKKMIREGNEPIIKIINVNNEIEAFELEILLIKLIGRKDLGTGPLLNLTDGGEGTTGHILTEEQKQSCKNRTSFRKGHTINSNRIPWNKGLTKEIDDRVLQQSKTMIGNTNYLFHKKREKNETHC